MSYLVSASLFLQTATAEFLLEIQNANMQSIFDFL